MKILTHEKIAILGASRGLGACLHQELKAMNLDLGFFLAARKPSEAGIKMDFSKRDMWPEYVEAILAYGADRVIYTAGGGPYKNYADCEWKDIEWSLNVSFLFPAYLLNHLMKAQQTKQIILVGSAIAEDRPDKKAAVYASAKHALRGLMTTVQLESSMDIRLFSPGYMDTDLLPPNIKLRESHELLSPIKVAQKCLAWMQSCVSEQNPAHMIYK